jgi:cyd operon protein YbgT
MIAMGFKLPSFQAVIRQPDLKIVIGDLEGIKFRHHRGVIMWYFSWILGVLLACAFGIINVMWMEAEEMLGTEKDG